MADDPRHDDNDPDEGDSDAEAWREFLARMGLTPGEAGSGPTDLAGLMDQLQRAFGRMFSAGSPGPTAGYTGFLDPSGAHPTAPGSLDWRQVSSTARQVCAERGHDPEPSTADREQITEAARIAESWLDRATSFPATEEPAQAWRRAQWITSTLPVWQRFVSPVATSFADAVAEALLRTPEEDTPEASQLAQLAEMMRPMLRTSAAMMYGSKIAEALGRLAAEVLGLTDIGLPLSDRHAVVLLPANVAAFAEGLDQSATDIRVYLALREAARQRLFATVGWLQPQLTSLVEQYAAGIRIDMSAMEDLYRDLDPAHLTPDGLQEAFEKLQGSLFEPATTPQQRVVLERLETLLALIEGWVDDVVGQATDGWMPAAPALAETMRRRRAIGGPAEEAFAALVGLELRPRRMRDAANLWAALREARGTDGRDGVWGHPDTVPTSAGLDDPLGFVAGEVDRPPVDTGSADAGVDLDAELERLLNEADRHRGESDES